MNAQGEDHVLSEVRRTNRNLRLTGILMMLAVLAGAGLGWRYLYNLATGPHERTAAQLAAIQAPDQDPDYFVTVTAERVIDPEWRRIQRRTKHGKTVSETQVAAFVALVMGERLLLACVEQVDQEQKVYTGCLRSMPADLQRDFIEPTRKSEPEVAARFLPMFLEAESSFFTPSYWLLPIAAGVFLWGMKLVGKAARRSADPARHPIFQRLSKLGDVAQVTAQVDAEMAAGPVETQSGVIRTPSWLIRKMPFKTIVLRLDDLAWGFLKVTRRTVNGIPAGKTFSAVVHDTTGESIEIQGKEAACVAWLDRIAARVPWALFGHSPELEASWNKQRQEFLATVASRRQEAQEQARQTAGEQVPKPAATP
jgi:hypothetical protein